MIGQSASSMTEQAASREAPPQESMHVALEDGVNASEQSLAHSEPEKIKALVVDANGLIKGVRLDNLADKLYTLRDVVSEVRDKTARAMLATAPFELVYKEPTAEAMKAVIDFSRKTGDFSSLSAVDLRVLALTYTLEKEAKGSVEHLRKEPMRSAPRVKGGSALARETTTQIGVVGVQPVTSKAPPSIPSVTTHEDTQELSTVTAENRSDQPGDHSSAVGEASEQDEYSSITNQLEGMTLELDPDESDNDSEDESAHDSAPGSANEERSDEGEAFQQVAPVKANAPAKVQRAPVKELADDEGWITPSNIHKASKSFDPFGDVKVEKKPEIACLTTDFAMQNVLIQMGLPVISVDGMLIKRAKTFVLRCHACFKVTTHMDKQFCPACGNGNTLVKVAASVDRYGQTHYHTMRVRKTNLRGTKYSIPAPKGGRHAHNIILREDQKEYKDAVQRQKRWERALEKGHDIFSAEYLTKASPFGVAGPHERAQVGFGKRNPNEVKRTGNRKKKSASRRQVS